MHMGLQASTQPLCADNTRVHVRAHAAQTWPGLVHVFVEYAEKEKDTASKSKKGGITSSDLAKGLRRLVQAADNEQRSGGGENGLLRGNGSACRLCYRDGAGGRQ